MVGLHSSHVLQIQTKNGKKVSVCSSRTPGVPSLGSPGVTRQIWSRRSRPQGPTAARSSVHLKGKVGLTFAQLFQTVSETSGSSDSSKIISFLLINSAKLSGSHVGYSSSSKLPNVEWRQWQSASHSVIKW